MGATQKSCTLFNLMILVHFLTQKGRKIPAHGKTLVKHYNVLSPERATHKIISPYEIRKTKFEYLNYNIKILQ